MRCPEMCRTMWTSDPRMLYVMKRDTLRPLDHADAAALRRAFDLEDE